MIVTCPGCPAKWTGLRIEHCAACHETFTGTKAGDRHRVGAYGVTTGPNRRRCLTVDEMRAITGRRGLPFYAVKTNVYGTRLWSQVGSRQNPLWERLEHFSEGATGNPGTSGAPQHARPVYHALQQRKEAA